MLPTAQALAYAREQQRETTRWRTGGAAAIVAQVGEPASLLDAHAFASVIVTLRLLGIHAIGVTQDSAVRTGDAIHLMRSFSQSDLVLFEPRPTPQWLGDCDAALWGAFDHGALGETRACERLGDCGRTVASSLGLPVVTAPGRDQVSHTQKQSNCFVAKRDTVIALAGALRDALQARSANAAPPNNNEAESEQRWRAAHLAIWTACARRLSRGSGSPGGHDPTSRVTRGNPHSPPHAASPHPEEGRR